MDRESSIVWFNNSVGHLWWWHNRESTWKQQQSTPKQQKERGERTHHSIRILLTYLGNQQRSQSWSRTSSQWMAYLKSLQQITTLCVTMHQRSRKRRRAITYRIPSLQHQWRTPPTQHPRCNVCSTWNEHKNKWMKEELPFCPVVSCSWLSKDEVIRSKHCSNWRSSASIL
jgi:hypothetical protein